MKGGLYFEVLGHVDTVVKTDTLTLGKPAVAPANGVAPRQLIEAAA